MSSVLSPSTSDSRPVVTRRYSSICHNRSRACSTPAVNHASSARVDRRHAVLIEEHLDRRTQAGVGQLAVQNGERLARPPAARAPAVSRRRRASKSSRFMQSAASSVRFGEEVLPPFIGSIRMVGWAGLIEAFIRLTLASRAYTIIHERRPLVIEVQHLSKHYGPVTAVDDVSFRVESGEILGFLGPNGAGKTTTMRIITGYMPATETAVVAGFDVFDQPLEAKRRTGYLPETPPLYPDMTVREYLTFVAKIKGVPRGHRRAASTR